MTRAELGQRRAAKNRRRTDRRGRSQGPARRHWERRRRRQCGSAPELRHRPSTKDVENELIGGGVDRWGQYTTGHKFMEGVVGSDAREAARYRMGVR